MSLTFHRFRRAQVSFGILAVFLLAACDDVGDLTAQQFVERAEQHLSANNRRASIIELKNALQKDPKSVAARLLLGKVYVEVGDALSAQKELTRARDLGAPLEAYVDPLGRALLMQGNYQKVLDDMEPPGASGTAELKATILNLRGRAQSSLKNTDAAERDFRMSLSEFPDNAGALIGLAHLAIRGGDLERAERLIETASKSAPNEPEVSAARGAYLFAAGKIGEAEIAYQKLVEFRPEDLRHRLPLANTQILQDKYDAAAKNLAPVLKAAPKHPAANYLKAMSAYRQAQYKEAKQFSEQVLAVAPNHVPTKLLAGASAFALEEFEQANSYLTKFLAQAPAHAPARRLRGATLLRLGRTGEAFAVLKPLADKATDDAQLLAMVGTAALRSGDFEASRKYFQKFAALRPEDSEARARLGAAEIGLGNIEQGVEELEKAVELDPKSDRALLTLFTAQLRARRFDDAIATARRIQENNPSSSAGHTLVGIAYTSQGKLDEARAAFEKGLEVNPGAPDASANLAALDLRANNVDRARELLTTALELNPNHLRTLIRLAQLENTSGRPGAAKEWLVKALAAHPKSPGPRILLARIHIGEGQPAKALALTQDALKEQPKNLALLTVVGQARLVAGQVNEAASTLRALVAERPNSAEAHFLLAQAYRGLRDARRHEEELRIALDLDANHVRAKLELADLMLGRGKIPEAVKLLSEVNGLAPDDPGVVALDAKIALTQGRYADAIPLFRRAIGLRSNTDWTLGLSLALWQSGDQEAGVGTLKTWLERSPGDQKVRFMLATRYLMLKRFAAARSGFAVVVEANPDNWIAHNNLAWLILRSGDAGTALPHAERALDLAPGNAGVLDTVGSVLLDLKQIKRAVRLLRRASESVPKNGEIKFHLARALVEQGDNDEARRLLGEVLSGASEFPERPAAKALLDKLAN